MTTFPKVHKPGDLRAEEATWLEQQGAKAPSVLDALTQSARESVDQGDAVEPRLASLDLARVIDRAPSRQDLRIARQIVQRFAAEFRRAHALWSGMLSIPEDIDRLNGTQQAVVQALQPQGSAPSPAPTAEVYRPRRAPAPRPLRRTLSPAQARQVTGANDEVRQLLATPSAQPLLQRLQGLGFHEVGRKGDSRIMKRGAAYVTVSEVSVGDRPATVVDVRGTGKINARRTGYQFAHFEGTIVPGRQWTAMTRSYNTVLQAFLAKAGASGDPFKPRDLASLRTFIEEGRSKADRVRRAANRDEVEAGLQRLTDVLKALKAKGRAPTSIVIYTEGPDAVGKTSVGGLVVRAVQAAGYDPRLVSIKGPNTPEERRDPDKRFDIADPAPGEVVGMDRGPAGDRGYNPNATADQVQTMVDNFKARRARLAAGGTLFIPILVYAEPTKQARTVGKRLARSFIAQRLIAALSADGRLDDATRAELVAITQRVGRADFEALPKYRPVIKRFFEFVRLTGGWITANATRRHPARIGIIDGATQRARTWGKSHPPGRVAARSAPRAS